MYGGSSLRALKIRQWRSELSSISKMPLVLRDLDMASRSVCVLVIRMSIMGRAAKYGTAVLPMCSMETLVIFCIRR